MRMPYMMNWSGGFQYEFSHNWLMEMIYQGTAGVGLLNNWDINAIPLNVSTDPAVLNQIFQATQNYKPYPQFGTINLYSNFGHNTYHAGTLRVERRFTAGLTLLALYTFSKALDESDDDSAATGITYYNRRLEKGRAGYDNRHHLPEPSDLRAAGRERAPLSESGRSRESRVGRLGRHLALDLGIGPAHDGDLCRQLPGTFRAYPGRMRWSRSSRRW